MQQRALATGRGVHMSLVGLGDGVREAGHVPRNLSVSLAERNIGLGNSVGSNGVFGY